MYELVNVSKSYRSRDGAVTALDGVSLEIGDGEWVAVQGPTGGGKSTLLQLLGALEQPTSGTVTLSADSGALDLGALSEQRLSGIRANRIGFVFQSFNLIPTLTAVNNVVAALRPIGVRGPVAHARAREALGRVGLGDRVNHLPAALSGGQQQRVAIARALVKNPDVILADEPTGNLDERMRDEIVSLLQRICEEQKVTLVMVTHDRQVASRAGRILTLDGGRLVSGAEV
ncbi:ABC transporter ATP-binding protein [Subtercola frigoramans]|uniref:ABC transport system ATP-binding protein n=1 Tax=Subtercola frigoramans TaxID=120298 RepID=A0ABS2L276_9MICO|nr:ABC transporter ATP-binding protein [Subtercola frigoramans]MBM7471179.1 putative ABC transport system ATP-binding protein [Subtercola frigoramans]